MNSQRNWFDEDLFWKISIKIKILILISGHSYEVDIWSIGCIMYTLLVGKPPFETQTLKDTYKRIRANEYHVPSKVGPLAKLLIRKLLQVSSFDSPLIEVCAGWYCKICHTFTIYLKENSTSYSFCVTLFSSCEEIK